MGQDCDRNHDSGGNAEKHELVPEVGRKVVRSVCPTVGDGAVDGGGDVRMLDHGDKEFEIRDGAHERHRQHEEDHPKAEDLEAVQPHRSLRVGKLWLVCRKNK
jgi:hypothetical protein